MPNLCVRYGQTTQTYPAGEVVDFDFTSSVSQPGQQILAYAVGLSGFSMSYNPDLSADFYAETLASMSISLIPLNFQNNVISVQANATLSDDDCNTAGNPGADSLPNTFLQFTVVALVDTQNSLAENVLVNVYGIGAGTLSPNLTVQDQAYATTALAGFRMVQSSMSDDEIRSVTVQALPNVVGGNLNCTPQASAGDASTTAVVNVLMLAASGQLNGGVVGATWNYGSENESTGVTGTFTATFDVPSGSSIDVGSVAVLLQSVTLAYEDNDTHDFANISCSCVGNPVVNGNQVIWKYLLNIVNPDGGIIHWYLSSSLYNVEAIAIAEYVPNSESHRRPSHAEALRAEEKGA